MVINTHYSWTKRWGILLLLSFVMFTGYLFIDILSPINTWVEYIYGWDDDVYGMYASSELFLNVFLLFLIIGGFLLDKKGTRFMARLTGAFMLTGALIELYAFTDSFENSWLHTVIDKVYISHIISLMPASAKLASLGFMIFGAGLEGAGLLVMRCIVKWFEGKELALALGIETILCRLGVICSTTIIPKISNIIFPYSILGLIFIGVLIVLIGISLLMFYSYYDNKISISSPYAIQAERFTTKGLKKTLQSKVFWIFVLLCICYYALLYCGQAFLSKALVQDLGYDEGFVSKVWLFLPTIAIVLSPFLCSIFDIWGRTISFILVGGILTFLYFLIITFILPAYHSNFALYLAISLLSLSYAIIPAAMWPTVTKVVDRSVLGSAYGLMFWLQNIGLFCFPIAFGGIYFKFGYKAAFISFVLLSIATILLSILLLLEDKNNKHELELPNIR